MATLEGQIQEVSSTNLLQRVLTNERQPWRTLTPTTTNIHPVELVSSTERRRSLVWAVVVGLIAAGVTILLIIGALTLANTNTTVNDVRNAQINHNQTLDRIDRVDSRLKTEIHKLNAATATVDHILAEAGTVSSQLLKQQAALCAATHADC